MMYHHFFLFCFCLLFDVAVVLLPSLLSVCCLQVGPNILFNDLAGCDRDLAEEGWCLATTRSFCCLLPLLGGEGSLAEGRGCD